jgi:hypothetical protein
VTPPVARWGSLVAAFAGAFALAAGAIPGALDAAGVPYNEVGLEVGLSLSYTAERIAAKRARPRILFLGDSLVMDLSPPDRSVPTRLRALLRAEGALAGGQLHRLAAPGMGGFSHYFLSEVFAALQPDLVILSVNLRWFSRAWNRAERAVLVGWLPVRRWPEAASLPLHAVGVTADFALLQRALVASGAVTGWYRLRREQVRVVHGRERLEERLQAWVGQRAGTRYRALHAAAERGRLVSRGRITPLNARRLLGAVFQGISADNPTLNALDRLIARFRAAGAHCLVYAAPLNVEHLRRLGVYDARGVERSIAGLEAVVRRHGGTFLDLHDLLADVDFADFSDHLKLDAEYDVSTRVARALVPGVLEALRRTPERSG